MARGVSKYRNRKAIVDGVEFDSQKEAKRYLELKLLEKAEDITDLHLQPEIKCIVGGMLVCKYRADFSYLDKRDNFRLTYEDAKGFKTPVYRLKKKLVKALFNIDIKEI